MSYKDREERILEYLTKNKSASIGELCGVLFVSEPTMRRDLATLAQKGKVIRTYGGASFRGEPCENLPLSFREREHFEEKSAIGRKCLELIEDGDTVMVDASSTASALLSHIGSKNSIVVITNNAKAPEALSGTSVKTFVTGGELAPNTYAYVGSYAEDFLRSFNADICFFSIRTLTEDGLLTDNAVAENAIRRVMLSRSRKKVLMMDSQKIGMACINTLCSLDDVDVVVCERDISALCPAVLGKQIIV